MDETCKKSYSIERVRSGKNKFKKKQEAKSLYSDPHNLAADSSQCRSWRDWVLPEADVEQS